MFANSRGVAENLTARRNELHAERTAPAPSKPTVAPVPEQYGSFTGSTVSRVVASPELIARSHHGSVSKEQRRDIEQSLKDGSLRCVVATSSLELGIDMGLVDLVIQVAAPPSVASALQRIGRASHQVGGTSTGLVYPRTRRDLIDATVAIERMLDGRIEAVDPPRNPLDVLAQQTVAAASMEPLDVDVWYARVRRAAPYRSLPRSAFDATLDMLAGRYPSDDFAGFRPRLVWNRQSGELSARPGAKQLAVTSAGTIPDRGMYSVMLPEGEERAGSRRVGEL
ncbi:helicase-related protein, partial [Bifidobacterium animalis]|uniref:helicase-related protein n=1 Tax=Bifidobacterium animalis TaxID=28025 RepID=UPI00235577BB